MALGQRGDIQRDQATAIQAIDHLLQADAAAAAARAQRDGDAVAGILQRGGQTIAKATVAGDIDDVITLPVDQAIDDTALAAVHHQIPSRQPLVSAEAQTVFSRHLGSDLRRPQGRVLSLALGDRGLLGAVALGRGP